MNKKIIEIRCERDKFFIGDTLMIDNILYKVFSINRKYREFDILQLKQ